MGDAANGRCCLKGLVDNLVNFPRHRKSAISSQIARKAFQFDLAAKTQKTINKGRACRIGDRCARKRRTHHGRRNRHRIKCRLKRVGFNFIIHLFLLG
jgi:hypothetical protein